MCVSLALLVPLVMSGVFVDDPTTAAALPIREVTVFKDGHALVLRSGSPGINAAGDVELTELPRALLGTFWAHVEAPARIASVRVEETVRESQRDARGIPDLLRGNVGREIRFRLTTDAPSMTAVILDVIDDVPIEVAESATRRGARAVAPVGPGVPTVLLRTANDVLVVSASSIVDLTFLGGPPSIGLTEQVAGERMTIDLEWGTATPVAAPVSVMYLQRGLRWIPNYRVTMLDDGTARVELQATLINELADLHDVRLHLAIGVPSFAFAHTPDPMALRESLDQLGLFFQDAVSGRTSAMLANAIMSQSSRMGERRSIGAADGSETTAELVSGEQTEDLFVFDLPTITLARGARMVVPVMSCVLPAETVYRLDLLAAPPAPSLGSFNPDQHRAIVEALARPVARHLLRLTNTNDRGFPLTTAPALVLKGDRVLAQGMMTYTSVGARADLEVGAAIDIAAKTDEVETGRTIDGQTWQNERYMRIDIASSTTITNHKATKVRVEVRKFAFGVPTSVGQEGERSALNVFAIAAVGRSDEEPWWRSYGWPYYWHHLNGAARFAWTVELAPGETIALDAAWHYFWR